MNDGLLSSLVIPSWPTPNNVQAIQTTRAGGISRSPYDQLNLATHVKDDALHVAYNRQLLSDIVPTEPVWLNQVHGTDVIDAGLASCIENADASFTRNKNVVCVTMTADCLPILLCDKTGTVVASVHAGWRSLCDGIVERTVDKMETAANELMAWFGPAIGPEAFEVGNEVRMQFIEQDKQAVSAFKALGDQWLGDLYLIARQRLHLIGVNAIYGGSLCTYSNPDHFFSYRRDGDTGRMATMIWLTA